LLLSCDRRGALPLDSPKLGKQKEQGTEGRATALAAPGWGRTARREGRKEGEDDTWGDRADPCTADLATQTQGVADSSSAAWEAPVWETTGEGAKETLLGAVHAVVHGQCGCARAPARGRRPLPVGEERWHPGVEQKKGGLDGWPPPGGKDVPPGDDNLEVVGEGTRGWRLWLGRPKPS
jgi:hypothetical protein